MHSGLLHRPDVPLPTGTAPFSTEVSGLYSSVPPVDIPPPQLCASSSNPLHVGIPLPSSPPPPVGIGYSQPYTGYVPGPPPPPVGGFLGPPPPPSGALPGPLPLPLDSRPAPPPPPSDSLLAIPSLPPGGTPASSPVTCALPMGTPYIPPAVMAQPSGGVPLRPLGMPLQGLSQAPPPSPTPPTLHAHPEQIAVAPPRNPAALNSSTPASASTATPAPGLRKEPVYEQEDERSLKKIYEVDPLAVLDRKEPVEQPAKKKVKRQNPYACEGILNVKAKDAAGKVTVYSSVDMPGVEKEKKKTLPSGWEERMSKSKKKPYYVNTKTGETTWERPGVVKTSKIGLSSSSAKTSQSIWNKWQKTSQALRKEEEEDD